MKRTPSSVAEPQEFQRLREVRLRRPLRVDAEPITIGEQVLGSGTGSPAPVGSPGGFWKGTRSKMDTRVPEQETRDISPDRGDDLAE